MKRVANFYQVKFATLFAISEIGQPIKKIEKPISEIRQPIKNKENPISKTEQAIKKIGKLISEIGRPIKKMEQAISEIGFVWLVHQISISNQIKF